MNISQAQNKPSFCEWFNTDDMDHLHAYHILQKTGMWPDNFVPERVWVEPGWQAILAFKLANKWIDYKLSDNNKIQPMPKKRQG
ncbi:MAG: hypothetical protein SV062_07470 [Thermodesulfobacteriota bacterium]|nr:hypothetical protein [Thermodesulfobacteriota bacterium]